MLGWNGVTKDPGRSQVALYRLGSRQIGHIHHDGVADITFPKAVRDGLISAGKARPHRGGFASVVSYRIRTPEDVPAVLELFRMSYARAKASAERRAIRKEREVTM